MSLLIDSWRSCDNQKLKIEKESSFAEQMGFEMVSLVVASFWDLLVNNILYFQMYPQLLLEVLSWVVTDMN